MALQVDRLRSLRERARSDPSAVDIEDLESWLTADRGQVRKTALDVATVVARDDPDRVRPFADALAARLDDSALFVGMAAAQALSELAANRPTTAVPLVPALVEKLTADPPLFRYRAARSIGSVAAAHPGELADHVDGLIDALSRSPSVATTPDDLLESDDPSALERQAARQTLRGRGRELGRDRARSTGTCEIVANALVDVAREDPGACAGHVASLASVLEMSSEPSVRGAVVDVFRYVAEDDPDRVDVAVEPLLDALIDDEPFVQARAIRALGFAESTAAIDPLRNLADGAPDDELAALASETAAWLEANA